jgi:hypothetical protein
MSVERYDVDVVVVGRLASPRCLDLPLTFKSQKKASAKVHLAIGPKTPNAGGKLRSP